MKDTKSLVIRFSGQASTFETTHQRLKDIAEFLGVSQNKAVAYAINKVWKNLADNEDMLEELEFRRHGRTVGGIAYLNTDERFIERVEQRAATGVPLSHEDDESLERNLLFGFLSKEQQERVRSSNDPMEKRRPIASFLQENRGLSDDEWNPAISGTSHGASQG